jgi:HAD superfamily hydrolase (TIGR01509 family)
LLGFRSLTTVTSTLPKPQLIIFDCDGVLVDSEPIANRIFAEALTELGLHLTIEQMYAEFVGRPMAYCLERVAELSESPVPAQFEAELRRRTFEAFHRGLRATPGIETALDALRIPYCVASSGDHEKMRETLGMTGLLSRFEGKLFSATQVPRGKPAPDVYLFAADKSGVDPSTCVVVEDSPIGVQSGAAAGMTVLGYSAHMDRDQLTKAGATTTFDDMLTLPKLIEAL